MTLVLGKYGVGVRDARGQVGKMGGFYLYNNDTGVHRGGAAAQADAIATALSAMTNGAVVTRSGLISDKFNPQQYGTNAEYPNVEDKAVLTFMSASFQLVRISIPAPLLAIFLADGETVDPSNGLLATLKTALFANDAGGGGACSDAGSFLIAFVAGTRTRRRFQRKLTIWQKDAPLTSPEE